MSKDDRIEFEGVVSDRNHNVYTVDVKNELGNVVKVACTLSGKLRMNYIRVLVGDNVTITVSPYDLQKGIITYRNK